MENFVNARDVHYMFLPLYNSEAGLDYPFPNWRRLFIKCVTKMQINHYWSFM